MLGTNPHFLIIRTVWSNVTIYTKEQLTVGGNITEWLVSSFTSLDSTASLHTENNIFSLLVKSSLVKLETSCTVILPPMVSVLYCGPLVYYQGTNTAAYFSA